MDYFTSDWHLNHDKIIRYSSRPFDNVIQMKRTLLNNINQTLSKKHDKLYMLGDMSFGDKDGLYVKERKTHSSRSVGGMQATTNLELRYIGELFLDLLHLLNKRRNHLTKVACDTNNTYEVFCDFLDISSEYFTK